MSYDTITFTKAEESALRDLGIAVFEGRIIFDAQPPVRDATLAEIQEHCSGPIPEQLVALWKCAFGGRLDYGLRVAFGGHEAEVGFAELFFPGSDGYKDLWGWIEHEKELAEEAAEQRGEAWSGKLDYLPFGGFEYCDRVYVRVAPESDHGAVVVWMQALPPAWVLRLHEDSVAKAADDVRALFRMLALETDPRSDPEASAGREMLDAIDALEAASPVSRAAAGKLQGLLASCVLDYGPALREGTIARDDRLRRLAAEAAIKRDDIALLARLEALGCALTERIGGGGALIDHALAHGSPNVTRYLLERNVPVIDGIRNGAAHATLELVRDLLARGAEPDPVAAMTAVSSEHLDGALEIARALIARDPASRTAMVEEARARAERNGASASRVESGKMGSNLTPAQYRAAAERFRTFAKAIE